MIVVNADQFAQAFGISRRASQIAFKNAAAGKGWHGETLAVVQVPGRQGGSSGSVWALKPEVCSHNIRAKLDAYLPAVEDPLNDTFKGDFSAYQNTSFSACQIWRVQRLRRKT